MGISRYRYRWYVSSSLRHPRISPSLLVIVFATLLHGLTPRLGILVMNVSNTPSMFNCLVEHFAYQGLSVFKIVILLFVVVTGTDSCSLKLTL